MKKIVIIFFFTLCMGAHGSGEVSKTYDFSPVRLTYSELEELLNGVVESATRSNEDMSDTYWPQIRLELEAEEDLTKFEGWPALEKSMLPIVAHEVRFSYQYKDAPISSIYILFGDYSRHIKVQGADPLQVNTMASYLKSQIDQHTTILAGAWFRLIVWIAAGAAFYVLAALLAARSGGWGIQHLIVSLIPYLLLLFSWNTLLPGTSVVADDSGILERYSGEMSAVGLLLALIIPLIPHLVRAFKNVPSRAP